VFSIVQQLIGEHRITRKHAEESCLRALSSDNFLSLGSSWTEATTKRLIFRSIVGAFWLCNTFCTPEVNDGPDKFRAQLPAAAFDCALGQPAPIRFTVARLVEAGYVQTETLPTDAVQYEITGAGRDAVADLLNLGQHPYAILDQGI
jgi:hypothetical protein